MGATSEATAAKIDLFFCGVASLRIHWKWLFWGQILCVYKVKKLFTRYTQISAS